MKRVVVVVVVARDRLVAHTYMCTRSAAAKPSGLLKHMSLFL